VIAKLPKAWTDQAYKKARRHGRAVYRAPAPAAAAASGAFTLPAPETPAAAGSGGNGHRSGGNGHRETVGFPWGGEDR
jgi:hypothetical protein